jgi:hypothetical protein
MQGANYGIGLALIAEEYGKIGRTEKGLQYVDEALPVRKK